VLVQDKVLSAKYIMEDLAADKHLFAKDKRSIERHMRPAVDTDS
jgi:hypothetical protein